MAHEIPVTRARAEFADLVNRVVYGSERVVVTRHGRPLAALVSAHDLARLQRLDAAESNAAAAANAGVGDDANHVPVGGSGDSPADPDGTAEVVRLTGQSRPDGTTTRPADRPAATNRPNIAASANPDRSRHRPGFH